MVVSLSRIHDDICACGNSTYMERDRDKLHMKYLDASAEEPVQVSVQISQDSSSLVAIMVITGLLSAIKCVCNSPF